MHSNLGYWEERGKHKGDWVLYRINLGAHSSMRLTFRCHENMNRNRGCLTSAKWIIGLGNATEGVSCRHGSSDIDKEIK